MLTLLVWLWLFWSLVAHFDLSDLDRKNSKFNLKLKKVEEYEIMFKEKKII
jgi:hypothetical protein